MPIRRRIALTLGLFLLLAGTDWPLAKLGAGMDVVSEGELRRALAADTNNRRRVRVHPRCKNLRSEMASYRRDGNGKIIKAFDHSIDALRYGVWALRYET